MARKIKKGTYIIIHLALTVLLLMFFPKQVSSREGEGSLFIGHIKQILSKQGELLIDKRNNFIMVTDTRKNLDKIEKFIEETDRPLQQVMINAKIIEVILDKGYEMGVQWKWPMEGSSSSHTSSGSMGGSLPEFSGTGIEWKSWKVFGSMDVDIWLNAISTNHKTNLLSSPQISTLNNKAAQIKVTTEYPIKITETVKEGIGENTFWTSKVSYETVSYGIVFWVRPQIMDEGHIKMEIYPEVSDLKRVVDGYPERSIQQTETTVLIKDGDTLVLSGLVKNMKEKEVNGVPYLKDIPLLGRLFSRTNDKDLKSELMILITPQIIPINEANQMRIPSSNCGIKNIRNDRPDIEADKDYFGMGRQDTTFSEEKPIDKPSILSKVRNTLVKKADKTQDPASCNEDTGQTTMTICGDMKNKNKQQGLFPEQDYEYTIQVCSCRSMEMCQKKVSELKKKGYPAYQSAIDLDEKGIFYRVRIGRFKDKSDAEDILKRISKTENGEAFITTYR
ncbi:SPOR domain-containing protein [bacterium]|nr:SPOR domain-containing protein [bacterium]